jgi:hypothetical protein
MVDGGALDAHVEGIDKVLLSDLSLLKAVVLVVLIFIIQHEIGLIHPEIGIL